MHLIKYEELLFRPMAHWLDGTHEQKYQWESTMSKLKGEMEIQVVEQKKIIYIHHIMPFHLLIIHTVSIHKHPYVYRTLALYFELMCRWKECNYIL